VREDKLPKDCLLEQVTEKAAIQNMNAFIEAGLATAGANRKLKVGVADREFQRVWFLVDRLSIGVHFDPFLSSLRPHH
jgi:hypothetical protein